MAGEGARAVGSGPVLGEVGSCLGEQSVAVCPSGEAPIHLLHLIDPC